MTKIKIPISVLDLAPVGPGNSIKEVFATSLALAQHTEKLGYHRYWLGELHLPGVATSATSVLIGFLAANTTSLRLGAGGIMLLNHSPMVIAEQFGTLISLYPDRIDLGIGRSPGTNKEIQAVLRRNMKDVDDCYAKFPEDVKEMISWFDAEENEALAVRPFPATGLHVPVWLLGSSPGGAELAAELGLPFVYAAHLAPVDINLSIELYRTRFIPSRRLSKPYVMVCVNIVAAEDLFHARFLFLELIHYRLQKTKPAKEEYARSDWAPDERHGVPPNLSRAIIGDPKRITEGLCSLMEELKPDEIMVNCPIFGRKPRLDSFTLAMQSFRSLGY